MRKSVFGMMLCGLATAAVAMAEEPQANYVGKAPAHEVGVPFLSKVPYISRLFKNIGVAGPACQGQCNQAEHIGVEFAICPDEHTGILRVCPVDGPQHACQTAACESACKAGGCQAGACQVAAKAACQCPGDCCPDGKCCCSAKVAAKAACQCPGDCCPDGRCCCSAKVAAGGCPCHATKDTALWEKLIELSAGQAAAEAALEYQEEAFESTTELLETLAGLHAEKSQLEAKLEAQAEHAKWTEQMLELATENIRLKAQVELAEAKAEVMRATVEMTVENERLKLRVAELEQGGGKAARTATRTRAAKVAR
jgi:hypothetical protein